VPDRNGKIFYTSITSLSHISKISRVQKLCAFSYLICDSTIFASPVSNRRNLKNEDVAKKK